MKDLLELGNTIREKRLKLNLRMEDVSRKAETTRATLSAIENGKANCSVMTLFRIMDVLGLEMSIENPAQQIHSRNRASRVNTVLSKKINRFIIMCIMQYSSNTGLDSNYVYTNMKDAGLLDELEDDYEDLHGMSTVYLNDYIEARLGGSA